MHVAPDVSASLARRFTPRPTTYNGTPMRSRIEAKYARWLDEHNMRWEYEPQCFASARGQYLPDFLIHDVNILGTPRRLYVELKPVPSAITRDVRNKAAIIWDSEPDAFIAFESTNCLVEVHMPPDVAHAALMMQWARTAPDWDITLVAPLDLSWWRAS